MGDAIVAVYNGTQDPDNLLRISTVPVPQDDDNIYTYVSSGETYMVGVMSDSTDDTLKGYWLEVSKVSPHIFEGTVHAANDNFADGLVVDSEDENIAEIDDQLGASLEPGEPNVSVVGTRWWRWTASATGLHTFAVKTADSNIASVFSGTSLENLQLLGQGTTTFVAKLEAGTQYHITMGRTHGGSFVDYLYTNASSATVEWGPTPMNDNVANAIQLTDAESSVIYSHAFATVANDEYLPSGLSHSLWWEWSPSTTGWYQFETANAPYLSSFFR